MCHLLRKNLLPAIFAFCLSGSLPEATAQVKPVTALSEEPDTSQYRGDTFTFIDPSAKAAQPAKPSRRPTMAPRMAMAIMQRKVHLDRQSRTIEQHKPVEFSLQCLPALSANSATGSSGTYAQFKNPGIGLRYTGGINVDFFYFSQRYALSTGLWYTARSAGFSYDLSEGSRSSAYNVNYMQVPLTIKWINNKLLKTGSLFLQTGVSVDVKLNELALDKPTHLINKRLVDRPLFRPVDLNLLLSLGYIRKVSRSKHIIINLPGQRSLTNGSRFGFVAQSAGSWRGFTFLTGKHGEWKKYTTHRNLSFGKSSLSLTG